MCVAVPTDTGRLGGFLDAGVALREDAISLPLPIASSMRRTELSRATRERHERIRKQNCVAKRQNRQF
jgi:hypothetical protein